MTALRPISYMSPEQREELEAAAATPEAQVLQGTAELLITDGWCQGRSVDDRGRRCLGMAVAVVSRRLFADSDVVWDVTFLLDETVQERSNYDRIEDFNDAPGQSLDSVLDLIAAARAAVTGQ